MKQSKKFNKPLLFSLIVCFLFFQAAAQQGTLLFQFHGNDPAIPIGFPVTVYAHTPEQVNAFHAETNLEFDDAIAIIYTNSSNGIIPVYRYAVPGGGGFIYNAATPGSEGSPGDWVIDYYALQNPIEGFTIPVYRYRSNTYNWDFLSTNPNINIDTYQKSILYHTYRPYPAPGFKVLPIQLIGQETSMWCWAATSEMVMKYYKTFVDQCEEAEALITGASNCCPFENTPSTCAKPGRTDNALPNYGFTLNTTTGAISFATLKSEIDAFRPVPFFYTKTGRSVGHIMVARGYQEVGNVQMVLVNDPWPVRKGAMKWVTYNEWANPTGSFDTFYHCHTNINQ